LSEFHRRPSSAQRAEKVRQLVATLGLREMRIEEIADLLGCSPASARIYVYELVDREVVCCCRASSARGRPNTVFRLKRDIVNPFPDEMIKLDGTKVTPPTLRDPLVAALFG
jgi:predicted ArsR family transcriptional regulator